MIEVETKINGINRDYLNIRDRNKEEIRKNINGELIEKENNRRTRYKRPNMI